MSGLPIRWKLTLAFTLALTIVLTAVGVFLHFSSAPMWTTRSNVICAPAPLSSAVC